MQKAGTLLISPPAIKNTFWERSVIIITEHHPHASTGLVLNKRSELTVTQFGRKLGHDINLPGYLYIGGPVHNQSLSLLHTSEWVCQNTMRLNNEFSISSAEDILPRLALGDTPLQWRLFLGMAGWGPGQLEGEIKGVPPWQHHVSWCTSTAEIGLVFDYDGKEQWTKSLDHCSLEFAQNIL